MSPVKMPGVETVYSIADISKVIQQEAAETAARYAIKYKPDIDFLKGREGMKTVDLMEDMKFAFEKAGSQGASVYIDLCYKAALFERQAEMLAAGCLPKKGTLASEGFPLLVDINSSTPEMLERGLVVPTFDARVEMLGLANGLGTVIGAHISQTSLSKSWEFAEKICKPRTFFSEVRGLFPHKGPTVAEELGLNFGPVELARMQGLMSRRYMSMDEAAAAVSRDLQAMIRNNPRVAELEGPVRLREILKDFAGDIGGEHFIDNSPISISRLEDLAFLMRGDVMDKLNIYPGYAETIVNGLQSDLPLPDDATSVGL